MSEYIEVTCKCGNKISVKPEYAGMQYPCSGCETMVLVPVEVKNKKSEKERIFRTLKALVADDSGVLRKIVKKALETKNIFVVEAENGQRAIEMAYVEKPDLILLDYNMPMKNGVECLKAFKQQNSTKNIPVIMVTANADRDMVLTCAKAGCNDYVVKPFTAQTLLEKVTKVISKIRENEYEIIQKEKKDRGEVEEVKPKAETETESQEENNTDSDQEANS